MPESPQERRVTVIGSSPTESDGARGQYPARQALVAVLAAVIVLLVALVLLVISAWLVRPPLNAYSELTSSKAEAFAADRAAWFDGLQSAVGLVLAPLFTLLALLLGMLIERVRKST